MHKGDHIYVMRGAYAHHGIYVGDGTVVHWDKKSKVPRIARVPLEEFSRGEPVHVREYDACFDPDTVVARALSRLGETGYDYVANNCEHFATWCKTGQEHSQQVGRCVGQVASVAAKKCVARQTAEIAARVVGGRSAAVAAKMVTRGGVLPFLAADAVQLGSECLLKNMGVEPEDAENISKVAGLGTSVAVGAAIGGPVGAFVGASLWGFGELIGALFS